MMMNTTNQMLITFLLNSARSLAASEQCPFGVRCRYGASRCWYQHSATTDGLTPATRSHDNCGQPRDLWTHQPYNSPCSPLTRIQQQQNNKDLLHPANQLSIHPNLEGHYQKQHPPFENMVSHSHAFQTAPPAQVLKQQDEAYKMEQPTPTDASTSAPDQSDHQVCSPPLHDDQSPARKRDQTQNHSPPWTSTISTPAASQSKPVASHRNQWTVLSDQLSTKSSTSEPWEEPRRRKHASKPPAEPKDNSDEHRSCTDCGAAFELSKELQFWYTNKGFVHPKRCPTCRKNIKEKREGRLAKPAKVIYFTTPPLQTRSWNVPSSKPRSDSNQPNEPLKSTPHDDAEIKGSDHHEEEVSNNELDSTADVDSTTTSPSTLQGTTCFQTMNALPAPNFVLKNTVKSQKACEIFNIQSNTSKLAWLQACKKFHLSPTASTYNNFDFVSYFISRYHTLALCSDEDTASRLTALSDELPELQSSCSLGAPD